MIVLSGPGQHPLEGNHGSCSEQQAVGAEEIGLRYRDRLPGGRCGHGLRRASPPADRRLRIRPSLQRRSGRRGHAAGGSPAPRAALIPDAHARGRDLLRARVRVRGHSCDQGARRNDPRSPRPVGMTPTPISECRWLGAARSSPCATDGSPRARHRWAAPAACLCRPHAGG
jgi:hypothetical protein